MTVVIPWKKLGLTSELLIWHYYLASSIYFYNFYNIHNIQINYSFIFVERKRTNTNRESDLIFVNYSIENKNSKKTIETI